MQARANVIASWIVVMLVLAIGVPAFGQGSVPQLINYQAQLTGPGGTLLDTTVSMTFAIYTDAVGGEIKWTETQSSVVVTGGTANILLGSAVPIEDTVFNAPECYLGVSVGFDPEMLPRMRLVSTGYAHRVSTIDGSSAGTLLGDRYLSRKLCLVWSYLRFESVFKHQVEFM